MKGADYMVLYRPRAADYQEAMQHIKLFDSTFEMGKYVVDYHNLYNLRQPGNMPPPILRANSKTFPDERSGWLHSQYLCLGNTPLGIYDAITLQYIQRPRLYIQDEPCGGLSCHFQLMDTQYSFYLGLDEWQGITQCQGYCGHYIGQPFFRKTDIPITKAAFAQLLNNLVADMAIKKIQLPQRAAQLRQQKKQELKNGAP